MPAKQGGTSAGHPFFFCTLKEGATVIFTGTISEPLRGDFWRVTLVTGKTLPPKIAGRLRTRHIQLTASDRVRVEVLVCDQERGRIVGRN